MAGREPAAVAHEIKRVVEIKARGYPIRWVSECTCGWSSLSCMTEGLAEERWSDHAGSRHGAVSVVRERVSPSSLGT